ncbi:hypothetical protein BEI60_23055 [Eisenbergiella tayi]|nr:hypothetical protein BEI60_23055 [Eisenbergiella tayi]
MYMKKPIKRIFPLLFSLFLLFSTCFTAMAEGSGNIDGGSGGMGQGTETDVWHKQDGVRVTVVTTDGSIVSIPFDLSNSNIADNTIHFGKVCKLQYSSGASLSPGGSYSCSKPGIALPRIISGSYTKASIETIRRYFCSKYIAQLVASKTGLAYADFISGNYKLVVEPIAYFTHNGKNYAMTATEAALYNQMSGGTLRRKLPSLTHQNLPLSLFLEIPDLGYPAWNGTISGKVSDSDILSALGIGIVSYKGTEDPEPEASDYTYRVDTDVITSITLTSGKDITPDKPASVTFHITGQTYLVKDIVMPAGGSQVVWTKWHTPSAPSTLTITASVSGASTGQTSFTANIISLDENIPPDPMATDTNPRFSVPGLPSNLQKTSADWSVWNARWQPDWKWESSWEWIGGDHNSGCPENCTNSHGHWEDNGRWVDYGKYIYESTSYYASLTGSMEIHPDDTVPTASGDTMKSGYGIKQSAQALVTVNAPTSHYTPAQTAVSYFPEFSYKNYWRLLTCSKGLSASFVFQPNEFSTYQRKVHFTPLWYPDGSAYTVYTYILDIWTPAGMLSLNLNDNVQIQGSLYDDWYSKRE